jgi:hypothetical protein
MNQRSDDNDDRRPAPRDAIGRRRLLAAGGVVAAGSLAGCLNRVASAVTNTGSSPAAAFAGTQAASAGEFAVGEPHVSRLTPTVSAGRLGDVELEGWVTSSPVMAQNHNSSRSNAPGEGYARDADADGDGLGDGTEEDDAELEPLYDYLGGEAMVAERCTVCLPDAEIPGGRGSIRDVVTPERFIAYLTGDGSVAGLSKADSKKSRGSGDCDDTDPDVYPGALCGTTPHFVAEVTGPVATGGGLEVAQIVDGSAVVTGRSDPDENGAGVCRSGGQGRVGMLTMRGCRPGVWAQQTETGASAGVVVYQVMAQPPRCPEPFPALLYVQRCESDDQLVYTGGWVIDDAALYEGSTTMLSMSGPTEVVGIALSDLGSSFEDVAGGGVDPRRGARLDSGTPEELVAAGVRLDDHDLLVVVPGRDGDEVQLDIEGDEYGFVTNVSVDAPVLHVVNASRASNDVKFKAGAELSKSVN